MSLKILFGNKTKRTFIISNNQKNMNVEQLRMRRAALRQALRDLAESLTPEQIDDLLDQINRLTEIIEILEKK